MSQTSEPPAGTVHPSAKAAPDADFQLPIEGFKETPEQIERQWFEQVYQGRGDSMPQRTLRAVVMGCVLVIFWQNGPAMWRQFFGH